jgi:NADH dehydrogenase
VTLSDGEHIEAETVIWAAGIRAAPLTAQIPAERDNFGRLLVDRDLRVPGVQACSPPAMPPCRLRRRRQLRPDVVPARTRMGAFAGNNAAAELLGVATKPYHQKAYVTCLDLGDAGALFTRGWERKVEMVGDVAKKTKQGNQHRLDLSAEGRARRRTRIGRSGTRDQPLDVPTMTAVFPAGCAACSTKTSHQLLP